MSGFDFGDPCIMVALNFKQSRLALARAISRRSRFFASTASRVGAQIRLPLECQSGRGAAFSLLAVASRQPTGCLRTNYLRIVRLTSYALAEKVTARRTPLRPPAWWGADDRKIEEAQRGLTGLKVVHPARPDLLDAIQEAFEIHRCRSPLPLFSGTELMNCGYDSREEIATMRRSKPQPIRNKLDLSDRAQVRSIKKRLKLSDTELAEIVGRIGNSLAAISKEAALQTATVLSAPTAVPPATVMATTAGGKQSATEAATTVPAS